MIKKLTLLLFLLFCFGSCMYAQNESNIWYFGSFAGLDFNTGVPTALSGGQVNTYEGSATISDADGQLLFYTDGLTIWNKNHQVMLNGANLMGNPSSTQAGVIVPKPGSSSIYYVFTSEEFGNPNGFRYSEVDITLDGGLGGVNTNKNILLATPTCEKVTAVKKADNTGYWVVTHQFGTNKFLAFSVTNAGIGMTPVESSIGSTPTMITHAAGYLKASPDGTKMVSCNFGKNLELYDFDAMTGQLSNLKILNTKPATYGAEFSPSGNVLYVTTGTGVYIRQLYQYNLQATNIVASAVLIGVTTSQYGALQLARDGKIYLSIADKEYLGTIHQPENIGPTCNFEIDGVFIGPGMAVFGLPQFIQSYFDTYVGTQSVCLGSPVSFSITGNQTITDVNWDFGDGNTSTEIAPSHLYANSGIYDVTVTAQSTSGTIVQVSKAVISDTPVANPIADKISCGYIQVPYNLLQNNEEIIGLQANPLFKVAYFASEADALTHTNILSNPINLPVGVSTFFAKIYNNNNVNCFDLTQFSVTIVNEMIAGQPVDYIICENPYDGFAQFDLETKNNEILQGYNSNQFTITYHKEYSEATEGINALPLLYTNTDVQEIIYARLENNSDASCYATVFFNIGVAEQPTLPAVTNWIQCSDPINPGAAVFDLQEKNAEILDSLSPALFEVDYYFTEEEAIAADNPITIPITTSNQTIYFILKTIGSGGCQVIGSFDLIVLPPLPNEQPIDIHLCDDNTNEDVAVFNFDMQTALLLNNQPDDAFEVTYHTEITMANLGENSISNYTNVSNPQTIYARITSTSDSSCFVVRSFMIQVDHSPLATKPNDVYLCSETTQVFAETNLALLIPEILNGQSSTDYTVTYYNLLTEAEQGMNALTDQYQAMNSSQTVYARVSNNNNADCFAVTDFQIFVNPKPVIEMKTTYTLCEDNSVLIVAPDGFDQYSWSTGEITQSITVTAAGSYMVTVQKNYGAINCSATETITVLNSSIAIIKEIVTTDWTRDHNSIKVVVEGSGDYEYALDDENYQDSPEFYGLEIGEYTIYVRDKNGCGVAKENVYLLNYPKFFTPNGDGYNDQWHINLSTFEPELKVYIFDRFGKFLILLNGQSTGWDGTYNGYPLPSTDYWFLVERKSGKEFRGHFTLKR